MIQTLSGRTQVRAGKNKFQYFSYLRSMPQHPVTDISDFNAQLKRKRFSVYEVKSENYVFHCYITGTSTGTHVTQRMVSEAKTFLKQSNRH